MKRDFLALDQLTRAELDEILHISATLKRDLKTGRREPLLAGKTLAMIFEKPSLRTRVTFEVGMTQLGGYAVYLTPNDFRLDAIRLNLAPPRFYRVLNTAKHRVRTRTSESS